MSEPIPRIIAIGCFFALLNLNSLLHAQHVVKNADELVALLSENKDNGTILLDGDLFHIAGVEVKSGAHIKPYPGRKPVLIGFHQHVKRNTCTVDEEGYWSTPIKSYGASQIIFLDEKLDAIPYSCHINLQDGYDVKANEIKVVEKSERLIGIPIRNEFEFLKNRDKTFFKNFSIKMGYWFVGMTLRNICSDGLFLYGNMDNVYNLNLLSKRPDERVRLEFINLPKAGDGIYLDGNDELHVPAQYNEVRVCTTPPILYLLGNREITFENITFTGANGNAIMIDGSNKHIKNCVFRNCGSCVVVSGGKYFNCSVEDCLMENLYNNVAIDLSNVNDAVVNGNTIHHTGTLMKGGAVVTVGGINFKVNNNKISDYSYIAINASMTREYKPGTMSGKITYNLVDNAANWGDADNQLTDGGGIYVIAHTDGVVIESNIVRNIGYEGGELWGIYLDDGAYNCTVRRNLVYNMWPGQYAATARYVDECEHSCMNNIFEDNIFLGPCKIAGNRKGYGDKTIIRGNIITGDLNTQGYEYVSVEGNKFVYATVRKDGKIVFDKK